MSIRPRSLVDVAARGLSGQIDAHLREFIDEYNNEEDVSLRMEMLAEEPILIQPGVAKAYLAAVAEYLSRQSRKIPPKWTEKPECFLLKAHFGSPLHSHRAMLLAASPAAFRRRSIFVGEHPLSRPHAKILLHPNFLARATMILWK